MENENNNYLKSSMIHLQIFGKMEQKTANKIDGTFLNGFYNFEKGDVILENFSRQGMIPKLKILDWCRLWIK